MFNFTFQDYKRKICALQVSCSFKADEYKSLDDLKVLFCFASPLDNETFDWNNKSIVSLSLNEVLTISYYFRHPNELYGLKNNCANFYHPYKGKNKNLILSASTDNNPCYLNLAIQEEGVFKKISYREGVDAEVFINKIELLIQSAIVYHSLNKNN